MNQKGEAMKTYLLYFSEKENSYSFIEKNSATAVHFSNDDELIWEVDAISWEAAQQLKHEFLGWEPYIPMLD